MTGRQQVTKRLRSIVAPPVAVKNQTSGWLAYFIGRFKSSLNKTRTVFERYFVCNYFSGKQIDNDTDDKSFFGYTKIQWCYWPKCNWGLPRENLDEVGLIVHTVPSGNSFLLFVGRSQSLTPALIPNHFFTGVNSFLFQYCRNFFRTINLSALIIYPLDLNPQFIAPLAVTIILALIAKNMV